MSFMKFNCDDKFYRAVRPDGIFIKPNGCISSAAFKSSNGCSVDYGYGRTDEEAATFMLRKLNGNVFCFYFQDCLDKDIFVNYEPIEGPEEDKNPYHCGLYKNPMLEKMTSGQCKHLSNVAKMVSVSS